jgi:hypothetical protein
MQRHLGSVQVPAFRPGLESRGSKGPEGSAQRSREFETAEENSLVLSRS